MMILGPRSPRKYQIHLHLEKKQKTPRQHHGHPSALAEAEGLQRSLHAEKELKEASAPKPPNADPGFPSGPAIPANPATYTARQLPVPIVGTRRSFPSPTMTPFLSEKKLTTSLGAGAGPAALLPEGLRAVPAAPPRKGRAPQVQAGASWAWGSTAGATDGPGGPRAAPTSRRASAHVPLRDGHPTSGSGIRGDSESAEGARRRQSSPTDPGPPPRPRDAKALSVRPPGWGATRTRQLRGAGELHGGRGPEFPCPGRPPKRPSPGPRPGPGTPLKTPLRDRESLRKCPYLPRRRAPTLARPESPPLLPPKTSRPGGEMGEEGRRVQRLLRLKLRLLLLPRRRLVPLFGGRSGSLAGGRGDDEKSLPDWRSGPPIALPSRGRRRQTLCDSLRAKVQAVAVAAASLS